MELVPKWLRVALPTIATEGAKAGALHVTKRKKEKLVQVRLRISKLSENPEILQISGIHYNDEDKCFRDFQSNSYI